MADKGEKPKSARPAKQRKWDDDAQRQAFNRAQNKEQISRILARLDALGLSQKEAGNRTGRGKDYINHVVIGKKASFASNMLPKVAEVLDCDQEYLECKQDEPRRRGLTPTGIVFPGAWHKKGRPIGPPAGSKTGISPSLNFPAGKQSVWLVLGDLLRVASGLKDTYLLVLEDPDYLFDGARDDDLVVVEVERDAMVTRTVLRVSRDGKTVRLHPLSDAVYDTSAVLSSLEDAQGYGMRIIGVVLQLVIINR